MGTDFRRMKISISATNPCHLYPMARALATESALGCYYSGYPAWKLGAARRRAGPHAQLPHECRLWLAQVCAGKTPPEFAQLVRVAGSRLRPVGRARILRHANSFTPCPARRSKLSCAARRLGMRNGAQSSATRLRCANGGAHHGAGVRARRTAAAHGCLSV